MIIKADLHLHSCLSPCGDLSMSPSLIVKTLKQRGVSLAALTDHNTALNCPAFAYHCKREGIAALYGMEAQTIEEVHVLCLFSGLDTALAFADEIYALMPHIPFNPEKNGDQVYVDENDDIIGEIESFLIVSAELSIDDLALRVHELGGAVIPAHVERPAFSMVSQLGFSPGGEWDALEVVRLPPEGVDTLGYPLITSSDAHYPEHIGRRAFDLDLQDIPLKGTGGLCREDGSVDIDIFKQALQRRPC